MRQRVTPRAYGRIAGTTLLVAALYAGLFTAFPSETHGSAHAVSASTLATGMPAGAGSGGLLNERQIRDQLNAQDLKDHSDRSGKVRPDLWRLGVAHVKEMKIAAGVRLSQPAAAGAPTTGSLVGVQWTQVGPAPLRIDAEKNFQGAGPDSGQVTDIAIDPRNTSDKTIYITANDGGVWRSTDGGSTWQPRTDFMPSLSMGALALDPGNPSIVYAGTGNLFNNGFFKGVGVYKSTDGGDTWTTVGGGVLSGRGISRMVMPAANVLLVATSSGLFRSADGGQTFGSNAPLFNDGNPVLNGSINDLKLDTTQATTIFAAVNGSGIFQSTDGGATFPTQIFSNANLAGLGTAPSLGLISLAQSMQQGGVANDQTLYTSVQTPATCTRDTNGNLTAGAICGQMYKSTDRGTTWANMAAVQALSTNDGGCQCNYDLTIGVDPQDPSRVYIGYQELYLSTDGGATFGGAVTNNQVHWDHHALVFSPSAHWGGGAPTRLYVGTDGGIATSGDGGSTWSNLNEGIATNLFRGIDIGRGSTANNGYSYGGTQDTGTIEHRPTFTGADWHLGIDGDGGPVATDPCNASHTIGSDDGGYVQTTDAGGSWGGGSGFPAKASIGVVAFDPNCGTAYAAVSSSAGGKQLFQSTDNGNTYAAMTTFNAGITAIATTKLDSNTLWIGLSNGTVQYTANASAGAAATWTAVTVTGAPGFAVGGLAIDPSNTSQVVVVYQGATGINPLNRTQHVFMTTDQGATWTDISGTDGNPSGNLPDLPLHSVVIDTSTTPHTIIVASDAAVMRSADGGASWQVLGVGLPTVDATSLQLDSSSSPALLRVGTYGRSVFELTSASGPLLAVNANLAFGTVPVGGSATAIAQLFNVGSGDLHISSITRAAGSADFTIISGPPTPVTLTPGEEIDYTIQYAPTVAGIESATFQINSDDPFHPTYQLSASGTGGAPQMTISGDLNFGTVARGTTASRDITVYDTGAAPLTVSSVAFDLSSDPSFSVVGPATPQTLAIGAHVSFTVQFAPPASSDGALRTGTLHIHGFDSLFPSLVVPEQTVPASGTPGVPVAILGSTALSFGSVAVDDRTSPAYADQTLHLTNQSSCALCDLHLTGLTFGGANAGDFTVVSPPVLPATIAAGNGINLTVRFNPSAGGARTATLTVTTDDPVHPVQSVSLSGAGLMPGINAAPSPLIFGPTVIDPICSPNCGVSQNLAISDGPMPTVVNSGQAELILDTLTLPSGSPPFSAPPATSPPTRVQPGHAFQEAVTFHPTAGAYYVSGTLHILDTVVSGTPVSQDVPLCGEATGRGFRVLVKNTSGAQVLNVDKLSLQSHGLTNPVNIQLKNVPFTAVAPPAGWPSGCPLVSFNYENQNLQAAGTSSNRGSYYVLSVAVGSKHATASFTLGVNEFKLLTVIVQ